MSNMHNPPHPGLTIKFDVLPSLGISVTEAALQLGVSRVAFSRMINGKAAISADMAIRLSQWLGAHLKFGYSNNFNMIFGMPSKRVNPKCVD